MTRLSPTSLPSWLTVYLLLAQSTLQGCDSCSNEPKVPFKLGDTQEAGAAVEMRVAAETQAFGAPVNEPTVDGRKVPVAFVRALLASDLDSDGDRDVVALAQDNTQRLRLLVSMRDSKSFGAPTDVTDFAPPGDGKCTLESAQLTALGSDKAVLSSKLRCPDAISASNSHTVISLESPPRAIERFELAPSTANDAVAIQTSGLDSDADGHADVVLEVALTAQPDRILKLSWLDRASGLSRDVREPDATFSAWAGAAQTQLAKEPEQALATAQQVIRLDHALCREAGAPELVVSGVAGIACGSRKGSALALATATLAHVKLKNVRAAFNSYAELMLADKLEPKLRDRVLHALASLGVSKGVSLRQGPQVEPNNNPRVHLPSARFVDDNTLLLRRREAVMFSLDNGEESAVMLATDELMRDPSGALCVTDVERSACGVSLRIERAPKVGAPYVRTSPVSTPNLKTQQPCPARGTVRSESGYQVLGWAPQGVVVARAGEVSVVPLDLNGAASAEPFVLTSEAPCPAPLPLGVSSNDGARYAELTPVGILVTERSRPAPELWRPEGYAAIADRAREVAISPSGKRVAVVVDQVVYVLTR